MSASRTSPKAATRPQRKAPSGKTVPALLAGGNPQIATGEGDAPVQAFIAAMPGWKRDVGRRLDALIANAAPGVRKAVKWNSPLYRVEGQGWFLGLHCLTKAVKVAFFQGASLHPAPSANPGARAGATWTSEKTTSSTRASSSPGSSRRGGCLANGCRRTTRHREYPR